MGAQTLGNLWICVPRMSVGTVKGANIKETNGRIHPLIRERDQETDGRTHPLIRRIDGHILLQDKRLIDGWTDTTYDRVASSRRFKMQEL